MNDNATSKDAIVIERIFNAPVDFVWRLWTQPELFKKWYGPAGFSISITEMDVRVGGKHLFCMQTPDGTMKFWTTGEYLEVVPNQRLVYTDSMSDEHGNILSPPADGTDNDYPTITEVIVSLKDLNGRTKMVMTHAGVSANEPGAYEGWEQAFDKLSDEIETALNVK